MKTRHMHKYGHTYKCTRCLIYNIPVTDAEYFPTQQFCLWNAGGKLHLVPAQMHSAPTNQLPADTAINNLWQVSLMTIIKQTYVLSPYLTTREECLTVCLIWNKWNWISFMNCTCRRTEAFTVTKSDQIFSSVKFPAFWRIQQCNTGFTGTSHWTIN